MPSLINCEFKQLKLIWQMAKLDSCFLNECYNIQVCRLFVVFNILFLLLLSFSRRTAMLHLNRLSLGQSSQQKTYLKLNKIQNCYDMMDFYEKWKWKIKQFNNEDMHLADCFFFVACLQKICMQKLFDQFHRREKSFDNQFEWNPTVLDGTVIFTCRFFMLCHIRVNSHHL